LELQNIHESVESLIHDNKSIPVSLKQTLLTVLENRGKGIRPALCLIAAKFGKSFDEDHIKDIALVLELLHLASLIHDDILDDASIRRSKPSIPHKYGTKRALILGDYLFTQCFHIISKKTKRENAKHLSQTISVMTLAEWSQLDLLYTIPSIRQYKRIITGKTAYLITAAVLASAKEANVPKPHLEALGRWAVNFGLEFQLWDDWYDFSETALHLGKNSDHDLKQGIVNFPTILALRKELIGESDIINYWNAEVQSDSPLNSIRINSSKSAQLKKAFLAEVQAYQKRRNQAFHSLPFGLAKDQLYYLDAYLNSKITTV
jgi:heptaprenyl diphosphate synthase